MCFSCKCAHTVTTQCFCIWKCEKSSNMQLQSWRLAQKWGVMAGFADWQWSACVHQTLANAMMVLCFSRENPTDPSQICNEHNITFREGKASGGERLKNKIFFSLVRKRNELMLKEDNSSNMIHEHEKKYHLFKSQTLSYSNNTRFRRIIH